MFGSGAVAVRPSSVRSGILLAACLLFLLSFFLSQPSRSIRGLGLVPLPSDPGDSPDSASARASALASARASAMNHFSLWAMPPEGSPFYALADGAIRGLSAKMKCVPFEPHVTVVGAFGADQGLDQAQVEARTQQLCASLKPYNLKVQELASGQHFFQCVLLKMAPTPEVHHTPTACPRHPLPRCSAPRLPAPGSDAVPTVAAAPCTGKPLCIVFPRPTHSPPLQCFALP